MSELHTIMAYGQLIGGKPKQNEVFKSGNILYKSIWHSHGRNKCWTMDSIGELDMDQNTSSISSWLILRL